MNAPESTPRPAEAPRDPARIPPRWFIRTAWVVHRALYRLTGGRVGLRHPSPTVYGMMRLHTVGRRSGSPRVAILGYFEDGPDLVTLAMNGWGDPPPAWWLNLQARPAASVDLPDGRRDVLAHEATGAERERLWACGAPSRATRTSTPTRPFAAARRRSWCWRRRTDPAKPPAHLSRSPAAGGIL